MHGLFFCRIEDAEGDIARAVASPSARAHAVLRLIELSRARTANAAGQAPFRWSFLRVPSWLPFPACSTVILPPVDELVMANELVVIPHAGHSTWSNHAIGFLHIPEGFDRRRDELTVHVEGWFDALYIDQSYCRLHVPCAAGTPGAEARDEANETFTVPIPLPATYSERELKIERTIEGWAPPEGHGGSVELRVSCYVGGWNPLHLLYRIARKLPSESSEF